MSKIIKQFRRTLFLLLNILMVFSLGIISVSAQTATIEANTVQQLIRGFGASNVILWRPDMTASEVEVAFGTGQGQIGFSILRIMIEADSSRWNLYVSTCRLAQDRGATIIASAWHAPDNMLETVNDELRLRYDMYDEYAQHLMILLPI